MEQNKKDTDSCCAVVEKKKTSGIAFGILSGLLPHSFCVAFFVFSIVGITAASAFFRQFLLIPNLFLWLVALSIALTTLSAIIFLKKTDCLCFPGIRRKWRYLSSLYGTAILTNLLLFFVIFPLATNANFSRNENEAPAHAKSGTRAGESRATTAITVDIPCSGHAPLVADEIRKNFPFTSVTFTLPNRFEITYNPFDTSPEKILSLDLFKTYPARKTL
jgi:hypothetical protein